MHKTKYRKTTRARPPGVKSDPRGGKSKFLEKRLSPTAQNHYANLEDTCRDKVMKIGVIVRYTKKAIERKRRLGHIWPRVAVWGLSIAASHGPVHKSVDCYVLKCSSQPVMLYVPEHETGFILEFCYLKAQAIWKALTRTVIGKV